MSGDKCLCNANDCVYVSVLASDIWRKSPDLRKIYDGSGQLWYV